MAGKHRGDQSEPEYSLELQDRRVRLSEQREARFTRAEERRVQADAERSQERSRRSRPSARTVAGYPGRAARGITQRSGTYSGKGMLTAELLVCFVIILIRIVADYEPQSDGTVRGKVLHPTGQYGPFPIAVGVIGVFFVLSFVAASGGIKAKLAVVFGGVITCALGVASYSEIQTVGTTIGDIGSITVPEATGQESSGASSPDTNVVIPNSSTGTVATGNADTGTVYPTPTGSATPNTGTLLNSPSASGPPSIATTGTTGPSTAGNPPSPNDLGTIPGVSQWVRDHTPSWLSGLL